MARLLRLCPAGMSVHIIQRGNNRQACFMCDEDCRTYLNYLRESSCAYGVNIYAWVLMTNHVHILAEPDSDFGVSRMMQYLGRYYVKYFNEMYRRTGTLWEGRFKSCVVDTQEYFLTCQRYIELNPVRAGMVDQPGGYRWSSFNAHAYNNDCALTTHSDLYLSLGESPSGRQEAYRELFEIELDNSQVSELREATQKSLAFGGSRFKDEIELHYQRRVRSEKPGPKTYRW